MRLALGSFSRALRPSSRGLETTVILGPTRGLKRSSGELVLLPSFTRSFLSCKFASMVLGVVYVFSFFDFQARLDGHPCSIQHTFELCHVSAGRIWNVRVDQSYCCGKVVLRLDAKAVDCPNPGIALLCLHSVYGVSLSYNNLCLFCMG